jgi:NAD-dependent deacetylase
MIDSLSEARTLLESATRIATFSGAGLSAESGISTFRDVETDALWARFDPLELASPEGFAANAERVIDWYNWRRSKLAVVEPNAAHCALARSDMVHITQNVDDLLERAGVAAERIHHLHGTITKDRCNAACGYEDVVDLASAPPLRKCPSCNALMRPAVVWFGERLPKDVWNRAEALCSAIDCLIVIGTSASVFPAAGLVATAKHAGSRIVVVNAQPSGASSSADIELIGKAAAVLPELLADRAEVS